MILFPEDPMLNANVVVPDATTPLSLRIATWDSPDAPGPVITLRGSLPGWESFERLQETLVCALQRLPSSRSFAVNLCELSEASPAGLTILALILIDQSAGRAFRVLVPKGRWAEFITPRLLLKRPSHRVQSIAELDAIAVDLRTHL